MKIVEQLPPTLTWHQSNDRSAQTEALATEVTRLLEAAITEQGSAVLAVSGGRTPIPLFKILSEQAIAWDKVSITLIDDRWLPADHKDSNEGTVRRELLANHASAATFVPLYSDTLHAADGIEEANKRIATLPLPIDVALLGMGNDGHTASWFPCSAQLDTALNSESACAATIPTTAPYERVTLTGHIVKSAKHKFLQLCGEDKLDTLEKAIASDKVEDMPIRALFNQPLSIYWAP